MARIGHTCIYWADLCTARALVGTYTLSAPIGVYGIRQLSLTDGLVGTLRLTGRTAYAIIRNLVCHFLVQPLLHLVPSQNALNLSFGD
jgi:hypothetical protein